MKSCKIGSITIGKGHPLAFILGPCVIESREMAKKHAHTLSKLASKLQIPFIFKASYDKANRSSIHSFRGPGIEEGLSILSEIKREFGCPVTSDIHSPEEALIAANCLDLLQIPAFLSRQTDLIIAAASTGKPVNIKKGQFMAPWDMREVVEKAEESGAHHLLLTDRGASFGYNNLVSDFRSIYIFREELLRPACYDASHSVQLPGGGKTSGGDRKFIPTLAKAATAAGIDALFLECHLDPQNAKSDAKSVFPMDDLESLLRTLLNIRSTL